mgnify:CR=1 FL=1
MNQYKEIKARYQDAILFFRLGDFYEMFYDDAITASHELELTLTGKNTGEEKRAPMCGVPYHAAENYIYRLIQKGYRVAICEQLEDPKTARGLVKRGVIKVITPGTILYENAIADKSNNYLIYIHEEGRNLAAAMADVSTGECWWGLWDSRKEKGDFFDMLLEKANVVGTPGSGFGPSGEGYFRLTAFGTYESTVAAIERIKKM